MFKRKKKLYGKKDKKRFSIRFLVWFLEIMLFLSVVGSAAILGIYLYVSRDLPQIGSISDYRPPIVTTVYSEDGDKIAEFFKERRIVVPLEAMPRFLIDAFIAAEDARFYQHKGVDLVSIMRAAVKNMRAGTIVQGGSTITQQVTKSFLLTPERSYKRKIKEAILAYRIDKSMSKKQILYLYLNQIYLGHGAYGVEAAANNYFDKGVGELDLAECAILAGLPQAPSKYSPHKNPESAKKRQKYVLNRMVEEGYIERKEAIEALKQPLKLSPKHNWFEEKVPYFSEHARRYVEKKYGAENLYRQGLKIYTTVNLKMQESAVRALITGLADLDKRQGYRGSLRRIAPDRIDSHIKAQTTFFKENPFKVGDVVEAVVTRNNRKKNLVNARIGDSFGIITLKDMQWARKPNPNIYYKDAKLKSVSGILQTGDVILVKIKERLKNGLLELALEQTPVAEGALLCMETGTGRVKAMIGGYDFSRSQFNRAVQSRRQPGSAFKPIIYAAALDKDFTPASRFLDTAVVIRDRETDFVWKPENYKRKFYGYISMRKALVNSVNLVTIKMLKAIGVDYLIEYAKKLGISSPLSRDLSIALGSSGVSLLELVSAYSVFANGGVLFEPIFISKIEDRDGNVLEENQLVMRKVLGEDTAYIITNLLESVVQDGTGVRVKALKRPVAGKTGTTNNLYDAWFAGYTPEYVTGVWVGFDEERSLGRGETGSRAASPIWLEFMKGALAGKPAKRFKRSKDVVFARIDSETGLLPIPESKDVILECFKKGTVPTGYTKKPGIISDTEDLFKQDM